MESLRTVDLLKVHGNCRFARAPGSLLSSLNPSREQHQNEGKAIRTSLALLSKTEMNAAVEEG